MSGVVSSWFENYMEEMGVEMYSMKLRLRKCMCQDPIDVIVTQSLKNYIKYPLSG